MNYCPSCGKTNPDTARFCIECRTRLSGAIKVRAGNEKIPVAPEPLAYRSGAQAGKGLSIASLVLAVVGLGIPAMVVGAVALGRRKPGRGMALAGVVLGAVGTVVAAVIISHAAATGRTRQALEEEQISLKEVSVYVNAVSRQVGRLESEANKLKASLGELDDGQVRAAFALLDSMKTDLEDIQRTTDEAEANEIRARIRGELAKVRTIVEEQ